MSNRLAVLAAAAVAAAVVAIPALADTSSDGHTITFRELNKGSRFNYIDNPPRNSRHRRPVFSVGDQIVLGNPISDSSGHIGELRAVCTLTKKAPARGDIGAARPICTGAFVLKSGTLFLQAVDANGNNVAGAIAGGTGAYVGARGTFKSVSTKSGANDTVTLLP